MAEHTIFLNPSTGEFHTVLCVKQEDNVIDDVSSETDPLLLPGDVKREWEETLVKMEEEENQPIVSDNMSHSRCKIEPGDGFAPNDKNPLCNEPFPSNLQQSSNDLALRDKQPACRKTAHIKGSNVMTSRPTRLPHVGNGLEINGNQVLGLETTSQNSAKPGLQMETEVDFLDVIQCLDCKRLFHKSAFLNHRNACVARVECNECSLLCTSKTDLLKHLKKMHSRVFTVTGGVCEKTVCGEKSRGLESHRQSCNADNNSTQNTIDGSSVQICINRKEQVEAGACSKRKHPLGNKHLQSKEPQSGNDLSASDEQPACRKPLNMKGSNVMTSAHKSHVSCSSELNVNRNQVLGLQTTSQNSSKLGLFTCRVCLKVFSSEQFLTTHMRSHSTLPPLDETKKNDGVIPGISRSNIPVTEPLGAQSGMTSFACAHGPITCAKCGKIFRHELQLTCYKLSQYGAHDHTKATLCESSGTGQQVSKSVRDADLSSAKPVSRQYSTNMGKPSKYIVCRRCFRGRIRQKRLSKTHTVVHVVERSPTCVLCDVYLPCYSRTLASYIECLIIHLVHRHSLTSDAALYLQVVLQCRFQLHSDALNEPCASLQTACTYSDTVEDSALEDSQTVIVDVDCENVIECTDCKTMFNISDFLNHMQACVQRIQCSECSLLCRTKVDLLQHLKKTHSCLFELTCDVCEIKLCGEKRMENHRKSHIAKPAARVRIFLCHLCGKHYRDRRYFKKHVKRHTVPRKYKCTKPLCYKAWFTADSLERHVQRPHLQEKLFACPVCNKYFKLKSQLKEHSLVHVGYGDRPFECIVCNMRFNFKHSLKTHTYVHTRCPSNLATCDICGIQVRKSGIHDHLRTHVNDAKKYKCAECEREFRRADTLRTHMRTHADVADRRFACSVCGERFNHKCSLRTHIAKHNKLKQYYLSK